MIDEEVVKVARQKEMSVDELAFDVLERVIHAEDAPVEDAPEEEHEDEEYANGAFGEPAEPTNFYNW